MYQNGVLLTPRGFEVNNKRHKSFKHVRTTGDVARELGAMLGQVAQAPKRRRGSSTAVETRLHLAEIEVAEVGGRELLLDDVDSNLRENRRDLKAVTVDSINAVFDGLADLVDTLDLPVTAGIILENELTAARKTLIKELERN